MIRALILLVCIYLCCSGVAVAKEVDKGAIVVEWNANVESDLAGYKVFYGELSGQYTEVVDVGNVTRFRIKKLIMDKVYFLVVTAYDESKNESDYSIEVSGPARDWDQPDVVQNPAYILHVPGNTINIFMGDEQ
jgi:hypothetical protein